VIVNVDVVQRWIVSPKLEIEVLDFFARRGSAVSQAGPVFDEVKIKLNVVPRVQFHIGAFPVNQLKTLAVEKKGKGYVGDRIDPDLPVSIRDEPLVLTLTLYSFPLEWARTWNDVEIRITDRWGNVSYISLREPSLKN
jgi:hypothetical protein